jgi:hypothetical protein
MSELLPRAVVDALVLGAEARSVLRVSKEPLLDSTGAATQGVLRLVVDLEADGRPTTRVLVRKSFAPLTEGPHAAAAQDPGHWAYWRREQLFYASGIAPRGPHVLAPRCIAASDTAIYLEHIEGPTEAPARAAENLGRWQASACFPDLPWLARNQLADRITAREHLDWSVADTDPRAAAIWESRTRLLDLLTTTPSAISHGDYSIGNLRAAAEGTVALDWATAGHAPIGTDCALLALSVDADVLNPYLRGLNGRFPVEAVATGYYVTVALTGASRVHWLRTRGSDVSTSYVDRVWDAYCRL